MLRLTRTQRLRTSIRLLSVVAAVCVRPPAADAAPGPTPGAVAQAISERRSRVAEFGLIKEAAEELGLRVWLFGGTAAGFAHYVRWDLAREGGDERYRSSFFDYDFTNVYRSTQDADLVVDGTPQQAKQLEDLVKQKMSFLQGSKDHWEVRLLRYPRTVGGQVKLPLLANPDFLGQNTDSNSTGMIELTDPPAGEGVVRDLRDWESPAPIFLKDVTEDRLHYYLSPTHRQTSRYLSGDNPEIFSVIRYLVKAFQYDLAIEDDDRARIQAIIDGFDPQRDYPRMSSWAQGWLERYGPNLIRHAVNIEYARETLDELGLGKKLISLSKPSEQGTLGWWLSREPLRTRPVGEGAGKTAAALGIDIVAHETRDFLAYESITRDTTLRPNVLVSRPGHAGESAAMGPGFYTLRGRTGAAGTGLTIRFRVDPGAREGSDFTVHDGIVLFTNRAALQVIPESLDASWPQYFQMLAGGVTADPGDRGVWMKLKRRLSLKAVTPEEETEIASVVAAAMDRPWNNWAGLPPVVTEWLNSPFAGRQPEVEKKLVAAISREIHWLPGRPLGATSNYPTVLKNWFVDHPSLAHAHPELVEELLRILPIEPEAAHVGSEWLMVDLLKEPAWKDHPEWVEALIEHGLRAYQRYRQSRAHGVPRGSYVHLEWFVSRGELFQRLAQEVLPSPHWADHPELIQRLVEAVPPALYVDSMDKPVPYGKLFALPSMAGHPEYVLAWARQLDPSRSRFLSEALGTPQWRRNPSLRAVCGGQDPTVACLRNPPLEALSGDERGLLEGLETLLRSGAKAAECD